MKSGAKSYDLNLIKPGSFVSLFDKQTIKDMVESKMPGAEEGLQLKVEKVMHGH